MDVGIDEAGQGQPSAEINLDRLASKAGFDCRDTTAFHADVDKRGG